MSEYMRTETLDEYGIKKLREKILQIAVYIDGVCRKLEISYYLMGGSALGAVRHGGFIPWDDDLDIFMRPDDYAVFRNFFAKSGDKETFYLQELFEREGRVASAKLRMNGTTYIEESSLNLKIHQGIFVDIFLLHNTPDKKFARFFQCLNAKYILSKGLCIKQLKYSGIKKFALFLAKLTPKNFGIKTAFNNLYSFDNKKTECACHFMGKAFFEDGIYQANFFDTVERVKFENVYLNIPGKAHDYLKCRFGDYMKLPSKESIRMAQHAMKWDTENDFSKYVNVNRNFSDEKYLA